MTPRDLQVCARVFRKWGKKKDPKRIALICPDPEQCELFRGLFPHADVVAFSHPEYDIGKGPPPGGPWDIVFLANTFMCSDDPTRWMRHLIMDSMEVWMQEPVRAWRDNDRGRELAWNDGDLLRFTFPKRGHMARVENAYDIEAERNVKVRGIEFYEDTGAGPDKDCLKFVARITKALGHGWRLGILILADAVHRLFLPELVGSGVLSA